MRMNEDGQTVASLDLLCPGVGEVMTGSQREERLDILEQRIAALHLDRSAYEWYLDTRRWGSVPHSGFGLGLDRMLMILSGMKNIREVIPFPRSYRQIQP
jgi:asparaginyl-tRNA synthetase